ncbi:hypothetical protein GWA97_03830 [Flavobacterium sp. LaA7.5]|nr:hypothetical protein [Flavobacterium salilacus subsp. altitudinum]
MIKFNINDEVYIAGKFGLKTPIYVWKINHEANGDITYTCSASKGKDEKSYTINQIYYLSELY